MKGLSPAAVLRRVAAQVPANCRPNLIVVGSLAAAYQLIADDPRAVVQTKDQGQPADRGRQAAAIGGGVRALLASDEDLREALALSLQGLLASRPLTVDEFRLAGERLLVDALEPFEDTARAKRDAIGNGG